MNEVSMTASMLDFQDFNSQMTNEIEKSATIIMCLQVNKLTTWKAFRICLLLCIFLVLLRTLTRELESFNRLIISAFGSSVFVLLSEGKSQKLRTGPVWEQGLTLLTRHSSH